MKRLTSLFKKAPAFGHDGHAVISRTNVCIVEKWRVAGGPWCTLKCLLYGRMGVYSRIAGTACIWMWRGNRKNGDHLSYCLNFRAPLYGPVKHKRGDHNNAISLLSILPTRELSKLFGHGASGLFAYITQGLLPMAVLTCSCLGGGRSSQQRRGRVTDGASGSVVRIRQAKGRNRFCNVGQSRCKL